MKEHTAYLIVHTIIFIILLVTGIIMKYMCNTDLCRDIGEWPLIFGICGFVFLLLSECFRICFPPGNNTLPMTRSVYLAPTSSGL